MDRPASPAPSSSPPLAASVGAAPPPVMGGARDRSEADGRHAPFQVRLADMHCHLDRMSNAAEVARDARAMGIAILDTPVTPGDSLAAARSLSPFGNIRVGCGLHPWWIADGSVDAAGIALAARLAADAPFVGEVGLDFGRRGDGSRDEQVAALRAIARSCARNPLPRRALSVHAVRSAGAVLDVFEEEGLLPRPSLPAGEGVHIILHWFSGTSDELVRARRAGCFFSVSEHMLASKRGREYARVIPVERLLLETDAPPGLDAPWSAELIGDALSTTLERVAALRGAEPHALGARIAQTSAAILDMA